MHSDIISMGGGGDTQQFFGSQYGYNCTKTNINYSTHHTTVSVYYVYLRNKDKYEGVYVITFRTGCDNTRAARLWFKVVRANRNQVHWNSVKSVNENQITKYHFSFRAIPTLSNFQFLFNFVQ